MVSTNKKYYILLILYALYSVCNFQIANCESLTNVNDYNLEISNTEKTILYALLFGCLLFIIFYSNTPAEPSTCAPVVMPQQICQAPLPCDDNLGTTPEDLLFWAYIETLQKI